MTIEQAIQSMQNIDLVLSVTESEHEAAHMAITALRAQAERENPQPLTLEELRHMDGQPVWFVDLDDLCGEWRIIESVWSDEISSEFEWRADSTTMSEDYGQTWFAYRYPPKGESL